MTAGFGRKAVRVVDYDPSWPDQFRLLRDRVWPAVCDFAVTIEHVGSTSVEGLAAKPVIDLDVVIPSRENLPLAVTRLDALGYERLGNLGIVDREAFRASPDDPPHNLYVCPRESISLRNHLALRDHLRSHPQDAAAYAALKRQLAEQFRSDVDSYAEAKTDFILAILARYGFSHDRIEEIRRANLE
jgi:GrpB-like predicted nucleotidyltransferase (UPF0157 family)